MYIGVVENEISFRDEIVARLNKSRLDCRVAYWASAEEFMRAKIDVDILLLDIMLGEISGIDLAAEVVNKSPETKIIMLTNMNSEEMIFDAIRNGAIGYVLKSEIDEIEDVIETIARGGAILTPTIALRVIGAVRSAERKRQDFELTPRQREILDLMVHGNSIPSVATQLGLSKHTVHTHVKAIYKKLNVHNRIELVNRIKGT